MQRIPKKSDEVDTQSQSGDFDNGKHSLFSINRLFYGLRFQNSFNF